MRRVSVNVVEKIKTRILYSITFFLNRAFYEINVEKYGTARQTTDDNTKRRTRIACRIPKATDIHWEHVILIAFPRQQWLRERAAMLRYTYNVYLVYVLGKKTRRQNLFGVNVSKHSHNAICSTYHHKRDYDFILPSQNIWTLRYDETQIQHL